MLHILFTTFGRFLRENRNYLNKGVTACRELGEAPGNASGDLGDTFCQPLYREFQARLTMYLFTSRLSARHVLEKYSRTSGWF